MVAARVARIAVVLAAVTLGGLSAPPAHAQVESQIQEESAELERVRSELEKARNSAKTYASKETNILQQLNSLDSEVSQKQRLIQGLERKEERLSADLGLTRDRLGAEQGELDARRAVLQRRLRNIYKFGERPGLQVLLGASSAVDLVRRFDWLLLVAAQDRTLSERIQESVSAVRATEQELVAKQEEVRAIRLQSEQEQGELVRKKDERGTLLQSVRTERKRHETVVQELENAEKDLQNLLAELEERAKRAQAGSDIPPEGTGFAEMKGHLPWPVAGKVTRWFGLQKDKRFGTSTFNGGLDIEARKKSDVMAVHRGRADYVNWLPGYGQCIILNHGGGYYTLYAHTSTVLVAVGDVVETGDVIATVGDTGSLVGDALHFEIRKDAEPINPAPWMSASKLR
jgi:septal ring factor EnvC (AmiA/AmiB activator)